MIQQTLSEKVKNISTKKDFTEFLRYVIDDFHKNADLWENHDIPSFLEAMAAWSEDMDGYYINKGMKIPENINWKIIADIIYASRIYE